MNTISRKVLVVEDEPMISMMIELYLDDLGHEMIQTVETVAEALARVPEGGFDVVVLDVNLRDGRSDAVAEQLGRMSIPFVVSSGGEETAHPWSGRPRLCKPFTIDQMRQAMAEVA